MTGRDRLVVIGLVSLAVLAAAWLLVVSPERQQAAKLETQVSAASAQLATAESQVTSSRLAQSRYAAAYASIVSLGKAVPPAQEVPSLIYELEQASNNRNVDFSSIVVGGSSSSSGSPSAAGSSTGTPASAGAPPTGFTQMPFTFVFDGTFADLSRLFQQLNGFIVRTASGDLQVNGRLLTIQSVKLTPAPQSGLPQAAKSPVERLTGTITATAYVLPAPQAVTGGATPTSPAGVATAGAPSAPGASSPSAPAIVRAP